MFQSNVHFGQCNFSDKAHTTHGNIVTKTSFIYMEETRQIFVMIIHVEIVEKEKKTTAKTMLVFPGISDNVIVDFFSQNIAVDADATSLTKRLEINRSPFFHVSLNKRDEPHPNRCGSAAERR